MAHQTLVSSMDVPKIPDSSGIGSIGDKKSTSGMSSIWAQVLSLGQVRSSRSYLFLQQKLNIGEQSKQLVRQFGFKGCFPTFKCLKQGLHPSSATIKGAQTRQKSSLP